MKNIRFARLFSVFLAMMLLFSFSAAGEENTWICPDCKTECTGNFCTNCGMKRPEKNICPFCQKELEEGKKYNFCPHCGESLAEEKDDRIFAVTHLVRRKGTLRIEWQDSLEKMPYKITFQHVISDKYSDPEQKNLKKWLIAKDVYDFEYTTPFCCPGQEYWIVVSDAEGKSARIHYIPPDPPVFDTFSVDMEMQLKMKEGERVMDLGGFSASALADPQSPYSFGAYLRLNYPQLAKERTYLLQLVLFTPDGLPFIRTYTDTVFKRGNSSVYWKFLDMDKFFSGIRSQYGFIPTGDYQLDLYIDGMYADSEYIWVGE